MNTTNKALIAVLIVQVALAAFTLTRSDVVRLEAAKPIIENFAPDTVERIDIYRAYGDLAVTPHPEGVPPVPVISINRQGEGWILTSHYNYPASSEAVGDLLRKVAGVTSRGPLTNVKARQKQFGVADDNYLRKVIFYRKGAEPLVIYLGNGEVVSQDSLRIGGRDEIYGVAGLTPVSVSLLASAWVESNFFVASPDRVQSITLRNYTGELNFTLLSGGKWKITIGAPGSAQEATWPPNQQELDTFLESATKIRAVEPGDPARLAAGQQPIAILTLTLGPAYAEAAAVEVPAGTYTIEFFPSKKDHYLLRRTGWDRPVEASRLDLDPVVTMAASRLFPIEGAAPTTPAAPATPAPQ